MILVMNGNFANRGSANLRRSNAVYIALSLDFRVPSELCSQRLLEVRLSVLKRDLRDGESSENTVLIVSGVRARASARWLIILSDDTTFVLTMRDDNDDAFVGVSLRSQKASIVAHPGAGLFSLSSSSRTVLNYEWSHLETGVSQRYKRIKSS